MAIIKAFKGLRPGDGLAKDIAALPYDVYSREEAKAVVQANPKSFLKVDRAETQLSDAIDTYDETVYKKANELFEEMIKAKELVQDEEPSLYIYRLTMEGRSQTGLVTCTSIDEYTDGIIKKHELTRPSKEQDRTNHVDALDSNKVPIFMTYRHREEVDEIIAHWITQETAVYDFVADDLVRHEFWRISKDSTIEALVQNFSEVSALYIADGHHRAASAARVGLMRREANKHFTGDEEYNYFLSVIFPDSQLKILDYNRAVTDINGLSVEQYIERVKEKFDILETSYKAIKPKSKTTFGMYIDSKWYLIKAKEGTYHGDDPVLGLDVSILQMNLLAPILGIGDPRTDNRLTFIGGIRGLSELERRVKTDMTVAFAMVPTSVEELMNIADAGELMPPKSTWFEPKLRSGLISHFLK